MTCSEIFSRNLLSRQSSCLRKVQTHTQSGKTTMPYLRETLQPNLSFTLVLSWSTSREVTSTRGSNKNSKLLLKIIKQSSASYQSLGMTFLFDSSSMLTWVFKAVDWTQLVTLHRLHPLLISSPIVKMLTSTSRKTHSMGLLSQLRET